MYWIVFYVLMMCRNRGTPFTYLFFQQLCEGDRGVREWVAQIEKKEIEESEPSTVREEEKTNETESWDWNGRRNLMGMELRRGCPVFCKLELWRGWKLEVCLNLHLLLWWDMDPQGCVDGKGGPIIDIDVPQRIRKDWVMGYGPSGLCWWEKGGKSIDIDVSQRICKELVMGYGPSGLWWYTVIELVSCSSFVIRWLG